MLRRQQSILPNKPLIRPTAVCRHTQKLRNPLCRVVCLLKTTLYNGA